SYSTCTFSRDENEEIIERFLREREDFSPDELEEVPGAAGAEIGQIGGGGARFAYRLWPHRVPGAGHFVAALRRSGREAAEAGRPGRDRGRSLIEAGRGMLRAYRTFMEEAYPGQAIRTEGIVARGDVLYLPPSEMPTPGGLNVVRPGVELGVVRGDRF